MAGRSNVMTQMLKLDEVACRLAIHVQSVRELIWAEELDWTNVGTGKRPRPRVADTEVERFIKARSAKAQAAKSSNRSMSAAGRAA
jgi:hypothetical protein